MILDFSLGEDSILSFIRVKQSFNRYGTFQSVNWHQSNDEAVLLSYYNKEDGQEYIAVYRKGDENLTDFVEVLTLNINRFQLTEHNIILTSKNILFVAEFGEGLTSNKITRYDLSLNYSLVLDYTKPGNFSSITLSATNQYSSDHVKLAVSFANEPNPDEPSGIKWYTIMIIALIVVIIIGVAYGMYLKMLKNRKDKKVSLLTEGEEVDEVVWFIKQIKFYIHFVYSKFIPQYFEFIKIIKHINTHWDFCYPL